ncbi:Murein DD-endopeptidase MepM [termite gut metagenome]|uniref:Murein DD-endopeptidase MepM n=1 Tax=termite gut metagenome TaxID=433724 RepID=A0A5J4Q353_9ZZZZ
MRHYYINLIIVIILTMVSPDSFSQDLLARQAPIDKKLRTIDSLALQNILEVEHKNFPLTALYPEWNNKHIHLYDKRIAIPDSFVIDLTGFCMPTSHTQITSPFGPRRRRMHNGLDIKVYTGDTIVAAFDGKVRVVNTEQKGYGKYVVIRHYNGLETVYAHLSKQLVKENQDVKAGEIIGLGGNTGRSYGSHLHFETRFLGIAINPAFMFDFPKQDIVADSYIFKNKNRKPEVSNTHLAGDGTIQYYVIKQGDILSRIALKRGISVETLCRINRITKNTILKPGQILRYS